MTRIATENADGTTLLRNSPRIDAHSAIPKAVTSGRKKCTVAAINATPPKTSSA
jgi:hypothetical protein